MPVTILETITEVLKERLEVLIDQTDYGTNVCEVIRPTRLGNFTPKDLQIVLTQADSTEIDELMCPGNPPAVARQQVFNIHCHVMTDETSLDTVDETVDAFASNVIQVVCLPASSWHTFDGNAIDAMWLDREAISADGGLDGVTMKLAVIYRTDEGNPYNLRT